MSSLLNGSSLGSNVIDLRRVREFPDAAEKAQRLRLEPTVVGVRAAPEVIDQINAMIDSLEPIQVLGGRQVEGREQLDAWFNPSELFAFLENLTAEHSSHFMQIINSVVAEFTPGPEVTLALASPTRDERITRINDVCSRYRARLVELGAPTPADLVRKRLGIER